jgi:hypothetical protein
MLYKQNRSGIICEVLFSFLFTLIFVLLVYYANPEYYEKKESSGVDIITGIMSNYDELRNSTLYFYYPNNEFARQIANYSLQLIQSQVPFYLQNVTLIGTNVSNAVDLDDTSKRNLFALLSFCDNCTSAQALPDAIQYTIYTKE